MNREDFLMLNKDIVYFDNGATTLKPKVMIDATIDYYANYNEMYKNVEDIKDCETLPQDIRRYIEDLKMEV